MFENITLEVSLKPFWKTDEASIRRVAAQIFEQWRALLKGRKTISVMLWVGDGSELLDYSGDMRSSFEWCRFFGTANLPRLERDAPKETSLHARKQDYMESAPIMTYEILRKIVSTLREECNKAFPDAGVRIGETFDIGPEFAISEFKYKRHPEACTGSAVGSVDSLGFVDVTSLLHEDDRCYAAYPCGIPAGTPFGTFFGKQAQTFLSDLGFDYLWLSNGLGFSSNPWELTGKVFDGERYYPERLEDTKKKVFAFWELFRRECKFPLETRGTNNSVGIDYASDGVPLYDLYRAGFDLTAPPNSPWAALNDNYGLEMMGHMTRICELPNEKFPFRYYLHDPWWINSPWYDRYDGSPCDIYLPMAISRITARGEVRSTNSLNLLSIDNSYGQMPDACVNEVIPHLLKAEKNCADAPAPLVWIYPMREYTTSSETNLFREMYLGDRFVCDAINDGLPLCCVSSTDAFLMQDESIYRNSILLSPVPENPLIAKRLLEFCAHGIGVILYGTKEGLEQMPTHRMLVKLDVEGDAAMLRRSLATFGYHISHVKKVPTHKPPTLALSRYDNALMFSVYNADTTTDVRFHFPQGAPILCGAEAEMIGGESSYRFSRGEQRECRVFVEQAEGVISCREAAPVNARYRRAIKIRGLHDATVRLFSERGCECAVSVSESTDLTPQFDSRFTEVCDEKYGTYLLGEHVSGDIYFLIGRSV